MAETQKKITNGRDIVQQWLYRLKVPVDVKKQVLSDVMFFLSTKGIANLDNLTKEQTQLLNNALGNYGLRAIEWKKYYQPAASQPAASQPAASQPAASQPAASQPAASQPAASQPAASQPAASSRQNLTFNNLLKDLGLTGKESANPEILKKVQAWLAARPGYKPGTKTSAYLKQLENMPATTKKETPKKNQEPRSSAAGKGYTFKNKGLYRDAMRAYNAGGTTFIGNDGNAEFFNNYDISKFTVSDVNQKTVLNPNIISALKQRF